MPDMLLRSMSQGAYDLQKLRIMTGNRIVQAWYQANGVQPGEKPETALQKEADDLLKKILQDYKRLTDGLVNPLRKAKFTPTMYIGSFALLQMVESYKQTLTAETRAFKAVANQTDGVPIWEEYLKHIPGCGPTMAGVLISRLDPHRAPYVCNFWAYCGLDVAKDGRGRGRYKEHLVEREYLAADGTMKTKLGLTYDPWLKTKLWVLGGCLCIAGQEYKDIYDGYKNRLKNRTDGRWKDASKDHIHKAAMRYMIKVFLANLWEAWRKLEGLPVPAQYAEAKLHLAPHGFGRGSYRGPQGEYEQAAE
jgi:transposase IS116/IS110/IS902 family protein